MERFRYVPPLPEEQSALSRWIVRGELALTIALVVAVLVYIKRPQPQDNLPFTHSAFTMTPIALVAGAADDADNGDAAKGQVLFSQTCTSCHGATGQGLPRMGVNLQLSKFVASSSDLQLIAFLKRGRQAVDAKNTTGVPMPARGGNLALDDDALANIVAYLRQVQREGARKD